MYTSSLGRVPLRYILFSGIRALCDLFTYVQIITRDEFPCGGVRVLDEGKVMADDAVLCCGISDHWIAKGSRYPFCNTVTALMPLASRPSPFLPPAPPLSAARALACLLQLPSRTLNPNLKPETAAASRLR